MGRPKEYNREDLLDRSVELFRRQGFKGTTTTQLVDELGINRKSMYAEFGSKQQLFEATLEHYNDTHLTRVLAPLEAPDAGVDAIRLAFTNYAAASDGWFNGRGCLLCNSAVERAALDPATGKYVADYFDRLNRAFSGALENGRRCGDVAPTADLEELAAYFTMALIGVAASIRAEAPSKQVHAACRVVTSIFEMYRPV